MNLIGIAAFIFVIFLMVVWATKEDDKDNQNEILIKALDQIYLETNEGDMRSLAYNALEKVGVIKE